MIHNVLTVIAQQLNEFMRNELNLSEDMVVVNSLVDLAGRRSGKESKGRYPGS